MPLYFLDSTHFDSHRNHLRKGPQEPLHWVSPRRNRQLRSLKDVVDNVRPLEKYIEGLDGVWDHLDANALPLNERGFNPEINLSRYNSYPRSILPTNDWVSPADSSGAVNAVGIDGVANTATTITVTAATTSAAEYQSGIVVSPGANLMFSFFAKAGTMTKPRLAVYDVTNAAFIAQDIPYVPGQGYFKRIKFTFTVPAGCVDLRVYVIRNPGDTGTIIIDGVQVEGSAFASSPILYDEPTRPKNRGGDYPTIALFQKYDQGAIVVRVTTPMGPEYQHNTALQWDNNSGAVRFLMRQLNTDSRLVCYSVPGLGGGMQFQPNEMPYDAEHKIAITWDKASLFIAAALNGRYIEGFFPSDMPTGLQRIIFGRENASAQWNGWLHDVQVFNKTFSQAEMEEITTVERPLGNGLLASWNLGEVSGTRSDSGPASLHLTDVNTVGSGAGVGLNQIAAAFAAGNQESLIHSDDPIFQIGNNTRTFVLWVYLDDMSVLRDIFGKGGFGAGGGGGAGGEYTMRVQANGGTIFYIRKADDSNFIGTSGVVGQFTINTWHFITCGFDAATQKIFMQVDENAENTADAVGGVHVNPAASFVIGNNGIGINHVQGRVECFHIFDRRLSVAERALIRNDYSKAWDYDDVAFWTPSTTR